MEKVKEVRLKNGQEKREVQKGQRRNAALLIRASLRERIGRLYERLHGLKAILQEYDALPYEEQEKEKEYMEHLRHRIRITEGNLRSNGEEKVI